MANAELTKTINVPADAFFKAIISYESYPHFVDGCQGAKILKRSDSSIEVEYHVSMMKELRYVLKHTENSTSREMKWTLLSGDLLKKNDGKWKVRPLDDKTCEVSYEVDIEFKIPVPGFILGQLVRSSLPKMIENFARKAKSS